MPKTHISRERERREFREALKNDAMRGNEESPPESYFWYGDKATTKLAKQGAFFSAFLGNKSGSILIWVIALSMILTTLFLFFGLRLKKNAELQEESIAWRNQKNYLESYAGYLETLQGSLTSADFEDIKGTFTQATPVIEGFLDSGQSSPTYTIAEQIQIEWNRCDSGQKGDLMIQETDARHEASSCPPGGTGYNNTVTVDPALLNPPNKLTLSALNAPFHYAIRTSSGALLNDVKRHLKVSLPIYEQKSITIEKTAP